MIWDKLFAYYNSLTMTKGIQVANIVFIKEVIKCNCILFLFYAHLVNVRDRYHVINSQIKYALFFSNSIVLFSYMLHLKNKYGSER